MSFENIAYERTGAIARIRLNRPAAANALDLGLARDLMDVVNLVDSDPEVRAVLLTGNGKMFCAGGDLAAFSTFGDQVAAKLKQVTAHMHVALSRLARMRAPVVVAVNGVAAGAGVGIACVGDVVLASDQARFTMAYTKAGLAPDAGSTFVLPRLIGLRRTQELLLTNRMLSAKEAHEWGMVTRVVPHDELEKVAEELLTQLASGPTEAFGSVKRLLASSGSSSYENQMESESREIAHTVASADGAEGMAAFLGKRAPSFKGC